MRASLHNILPQHHYAELCAGTNAITKKFMAEMEAADREMIRKGVSERSMAAISVAKRGKIARDLIKARFAEIAKANQGVYTTTGFNFYDLRAPVELDYPVNTPIRNSLPRIGRVNDGVGVAAHWQATKNPGFVYAGVLEGQRNQIATPDNNNYIASYKEIGIERGVTFTAQAAGEGYADNVADEHLRGFHELSLQEEGIMLMGNSGTAAGNNGFALGTCPTPTATLAAGGTLGGGVNVSCRCVAMTGLANPTNVQYGYGLFPTVASGLTPVYTRANQDGSTTTINGGTSAVSLASNVVVTTTPDQSVTFAIAAANAPKGAFYYAWYVDITDASAPSAANAYLAGITSVPTFTITAAPTGTQTAAAAGLNVDHSYQPTDFDGLLTYAATQGYWKNLGGASFTTGAGGVVNEIDAVLYYLWSTYQAQVDEILCSTDARANLTAAVMYAGGNSNIRFNYERDSQNNLLGGVVVSGYQNQYTMDERGGNVLPIRTHPMLPPGTIYFNIKTNPYPQSRAPFVAGMLVQRDYYSIEWPVVTREWTFGTYAHEVLAHHFPWLSAAITGIGTFAG